MAGETIELFTRVPFDFSGLATATNTEVVMNPYVDVSQWNQGVLLVRVTALSLAANAEIRVLARPASLSAEDPNTTFVTSTNETNLNVVGTAPLLLIAPLTANFGGGLRIFVRGVRGATAGSFITATLAASLVMKD